MKLWNYLKILKTKPGKTLQIKTYHLLHNNNIIHKINVKNHTLNTTTYRLLRHFTSDQYEIAYLMRNKRGFNTFLFKIHYDVVVCDPQGKILATYIDLAPGYISKHFAQGYFIYFMAVGSIKHYELHKLDILRLKKIT